MRNAPAALSVLALATVACAPQDLDWAIRFEPATLSSTVVRLDARILKGPCPGTEVLWNETVHPGGGVDEPPELPEGTYCFGARAGDAACQWFAAGATEAVLPREGAITVVVRAQTPESNCTATCEAGLCGGGSTDAGVDPDGGGENCSAGGCTRECDTATTCAHGCSGGACVMRCTTGADCDFTCSGGGCDIQCDTGATCTASCSGGRCNMACSGGSDCDFRCSGGTCSFSCDLTAGTCNTSCPSGDCTGG